MRITNRNKLPEVFVDVVKNDDYTKGRATYSITELLAPPRISTLKRENADRLEEDVSDQIYLILGKLMHGLLEKANRVAIAERRYYLDLDGEVISGGLDALYDDVRSLIQDYKLMSWHEIKDGLKPEKEQQLNCYAYLAKHGYFYDKRDTQFTTKQVAPINAQFLQIVSILRDWSRTRAGYDGMPAEQIVTISIRRWTDEKALTFLRERLAIHKRARMELPECTPDERWQRGEAWAVMKKGGKRAISGGLQASPEAAAKLATAKGLDHYVQYRPGVAFRCIYYCPVAKFCEQWARDPRNPINLPKEKVTNDEEDSDGYQSVG